MAAAVGYWASVTPLALPADPAAMDPSQLVIALRIGEGGPGKRPPPLFWWCLLPVWTLTLHLLPGMCVHRQGPM